MSVEAVTWALNLAPVPADSGGKPSTACAFVLVGLANHAAPDGTGAFPSVKTLTLYTRMSERSVQTALRRLEAEGLIRPCAPEIVAARIRRADRRPNGWDLALDRIRTDFDDDTLASLERQIPGVTARVLTARQAAGDTSRQASADTSEPVDNARNTVENLAGSRADGVQPLHPAPSTGCNEGSNGVQPALERGAVAAPEPSYEPSREPSSLTSELAARDSDADPRGRRGDIERVCARLADRIEANGSRRPRITARWRQAARLLLDQDGRTEEQVMACIDWCQEHEFWRSNILSMPKLREQYDRMRLQAENQRDHVSPGAVVPIDRRQHATDALFSRALARARILDAREARGDP